jgi:GDP-mannose 6-dehydrogenase
VRVSVFGLGYVGCVTGACLARDGHTVVGVDVNPDKVDMVNAGRSPIVEPGLGDLLARVVREGRFRATVDAEDAVLESDVVLLCVGTPSLPNGRLDVSALERVSHAIGHVLPRRQGSLTVVIRSTVLPGTSEAVVAPALLAGGGLRFAGSLHIAVNPEFMREGTSIRDFSHPPITLVGCDDPATATLMRDLYRAVDAPFVHTTRRTAEMAKYVANAFHALKVSFANEIGDVCTALGADAQEVMRIFALDTKLSLSSAYLRPGFAFGGSCLGKDLRALLYQARTADVLPPLLSSVLPANEAQVRRGIDAALAPGKRRVGVVGLAFKEGTDDLRESPMVSLVEALIGKGCDVRILDSNVAVGRLVGANRRYIEEQIPHIASLMCADVEALLSHAEVLVIGNTGPEAAQALEGAGPEHTVVDLTRGRARRPLAPEAAA